jgi:hypothetical protein
LLLALHPVRQQLDSASKQPATARCNVPMD